MDSDVAQANDLKGVIDVADFNDADKLGKGKDMVEPLTDVLSIWIGTSSHFAHSTPHNVFATRR